MIERHYEPTGSERADEILSNREEENDKFFQIYPPSEANTPIVAATGSNTDVPRVSASAPSGAVCFLLAGAKMSPEQTQ
jgi:glutamate synthase (ferredoxin)